MADQCVTCKIRLSNNYPVPNPDNLPEMPCCVECDYSPYKIKTIKPIETKHNGYLFRSRLEARWAVFFDALGLQYEYEHEGYDLGDLGWYLPDFWLPEVKMFAEVKANKLSDTEREKCVELVKQSGHGCLMLVGTPDVKPYYAIQKWHVEYVDCEFLLSGVYLSDQNRLVDTAYDGGDTSPYSDTIIAVEKARSARFEHGNR